MDTSVISLLLLKKKKKAKMFPKAANDNFTSEVERNLTAFQLPPPLLCFSDWPTGCLTDMPSLCIRLMLNGSGMVLNSSPVPSLPQALSNCSQASRLQICFLVRLEEVVIPTFLCWFMTCTASYSITVLFKSFRDISQ